MSNTQNSQDSLPGTAGSPVERIANSESRVRMPKKNEPPQAGRTRADAYKAATAATSHAVIEEEVVDEELEPVKRKPGRPPKVATDQ